MLLQSSDHGCAGLTGPIPELPTALAHIMQVFNIDQTNLSQPCLANSKQFGGSDLPISVGKLSHSENSEYTTCLPNFLAFDSDVLKKSVYRETFLCPAVRWNHQIADDGTLNAPDLTIPVRKRPTQLVHGSHNRIAADNPKHCPTTPYSHNLYHLCQPNVAHLDWPWPASHLAHGKMCSV